MSHIESAIWSRPELSPQRLREPPLALPSLVPARPPGFRWFPDRHSEALVDRVIR
ncbi:hypothetical protein FKP32DRAFT_1587524 [Trametes sanguinea]|nr:hypothetical protein FKP32DRAFT_1587524 [Trametes sanguinea]